MSGIAYPDLREYTHTAASSARPLVALGWRKPPPWGPVTRQQHFLIGLRLPRHERRIAKEPAALVDSPSEHTDRWQRVYTAPRREAVLPEVDTWFWIDCVVADLEGLHRASTAAPRAKSTDWVIADGLTRVLAGCVLTQLYGAQTAGAARGLLRRLVGHHRKSGAPPYRPVGHNI